ncbi:DUF11 domain-containing protein [Lysobacter antibioticus]|uniref:DUF11 domain-containing protein n=1 Tax=Lysobacter antibioticus TaxID=84531 RepID=UPI00034D0E4A|nr:DUF11 domain-containing protein [Lysobacter antibioticus]
MAIVSRPPARGWRARLAALLLAAALPAAPVAAQTCTPLFNESFGFGSGASRIGPPLSPTQTTYRYEDTAPPCIGPDCRVNDGEYALVQSPRSDGGNSAWRDGADHTGDPNGYMMLVNADFAPGVFYSRDFNGLAVGVRHDFTAWLSNVQEYLPGDGDIDPNVTFRIVDPATGAVLGSVSSGDIPELPGTVLTWNEYGVSFVPTQSSLRLEVVNNSPGGPGNDLALDDISLTALDACASDVSLSKRVSDANGNGIAEPGETLTYAITLRNAGNLTAIDYDVIDNLDPNTVYVSSDQGGSHDGAASGGRIEWQNLSIAPGASVVLNVVVRVVDPVPAGVQRILNRAYNPDRGPPDCDSDPSLPGCAQIPTAPAVSVRKALSAESGSVAGRAEAGETLSYVLTLSNTGGSAASNHAFYELLPAHTELVSVSGAVVSGCAIGDRGAKPCLLSVAGPIAGNGGTATAGFVVRVLDPIPAGVSAIYNLVTDGGGTPPPACDPASDPNGCAGPPPGCSVATDPDHCVATPVIQPRVTVSKRLSGESGSLADVAEPGETLSYTLTLVNGAAIAAANHRFYERLPAHTTLVSVSGASLSDCAIGDAGARACTLAVAGPIAGDGGRAEVVVAVRVADPIPAGVSAIYNLVTDDTGAPPPACDPAADPDGCAGPPPGCDVAADPQHCVAVPVASALSVRKQVQGAPQPVAGSADEFVVRYRIEVRNQGAAAGRYDLRDAPRFGAGVSLLSVRADRNGEALNLSGAAPWTLASGRDLAAGASDGYLLEVRVRVAAEAAADSAALACLAGEAGRGLYNEALLSYGGREQRDDACVDTPLPSTDAQLAVEKTGSVREAEVGDLIVYSVRIRNRGPGLAIAPVLVDRLPAGFRLIENTAQVQGARLLSLTGAPGPVLRIALDRLAPGAQALLRYRVRVGVGARQGDGINRVHAECGDAAGGAATRTCSNQAQWKVDLRGGVFADEACVVGQIFVDCDRNSVKDREELGIPGVRLYFEDGTYLISDVEGKYSHCGLRPVTHALKVDPSTLPTDSRLTTSGSRNAGDAQSLFVDLKNGQLHRADFVEGSCSNAVLEQVKARRANGEVRSVETESGQPALRFEGKAADAPQQATESADQPIERSRHGRDG